MSLFQGALLAQVAAERFNRAPLPAGTDKSGYARYFSSVGSAVETTLRNWCANARMVGVVIQGPVASGGQMLGADLASQLLAVLPKETPERLKLSNAVANGLAQQWRGFVAGVKVPGMPLFPPFAAVPAPFAPLVPGVPTPLASCCASVRTLLDEAPLKQALVRTLGNPPSPCAVPALEAVAAGLAKAMAPWLGGTIMQLVGSGPVPSFRPPRVPVGPVVGGVAVMNAGGLV
jgi:hypothetical protein